MHTSLNWLVSVEHDRFGLICFDLCAKSTIVLLVALAVAVFSRGMSSAFRHRIWCLALISLLLLPWLSSLLPVWHLPFLPEMDIASSQRQANLETVDIAATVPEEPGNGYAPGGKKVTASSNLTAAPMSSEGDVFSTAPSLTAEPLTGPITTADALPLEWSARRLRWRGLVLCLWMAGFFVSTLPVTVSLIHNHFLSRSSVPVVDTERTRLISSLCERLELKRSIRLLETTRCVVPMTWGVLRPIVLFPIAWREWTDERRRFVLLHELAHVKRYDFATQLIARLACGAYWFQPLAWYALRRLRIEREIACDDCVVTTGARASDYARQLVSIARSYRLQMLPSAVAISETTNLENRVQAVLDRARSHLPLSRTAARLLLVVTCIIVTCVAVIRPTAQAATEKPAKKSTSESEASNSADVAASDTAPVEQSAGIPGSEKRKSEGIDIDNVTLHYRGQVVDPEGKPVAGAKVFFVYWIHGTPLADRKEPRAITDDDGWFDFKTARSDFEPNADGAFLNCSLVATADGYGFIKISSIVFETTGEAKIRVSDQVLLHLRKSLSKPRKVLQLVRDDTPITGRVVTIDGEPVKDARIRVDRVWGNREGTLDGWELAAKEEKPDFFSLRRHTPEITSGPGLSSIIPDVTSDGDGRFTLRGIGRERIVQLLIGGPSIETSKVKTRTRPGETIVVPRQSGPQERYYAADFTHVAGGSKPIVGRIVDADTKEPISGVLVSAGNQGTFKRVGKPWIATRSDDQGRYRLEGLPIGRDDRIYLFPPDDSGYLPTGQSVNSKVDEPAVALDYELREGQWVRGRAIDDRTGEPLRGQVSYYADEGNKHLKSFPGFSRVILYERRAESDGRFAIPVPPGRGVITFMPDDAASYRRGVGVSSITLPGVTNGGGSGRKMYRTRPIDLISTNVSLLRQIELAVDSDPIDLTLALTSGVDVDGRVVDSDGKEITGCIMKGGVNPGGWYSMEDATIHVKGHYRDLPRDLYFYHPVRNLAGHCHLEGEPPPNLKVTLLESGSVQGRLVDDAGSPISGVRLFGEAIPSERFGNPELRLATDDDGRFLIRGLIPGLKYTVRGMGNGVSSRVLFDVTVENEKTKDVGEVKLQPALQPTVIFFSADAKSVGRTLTTWWRMRGPLAGGNNGRGGFGPRGGGPLDGSPSRSRLNPVIT